MLASFFKSLWICLIFFTEMGLRLIPVVDSGIQVWNAVEVNKIAAEGGMKYPEPILDSYEKLQRVFNREKAVQAVLYRTSLFTAFLDTLDEMPYSHDKIEQFFKEMNVELDFCEKWCENMGEFEVCGTSCDATIMDEAYIRLVIESGFERPYVPPLNYTR